jgi:solute carrier family 25 (mitochondrial carnitine/acylcarnitine transporter), member 20/29
LGVVLGIIEVSTGGQMTTHEAFTANAAVESMIITAPPDELEASGELHGKYCTTAVIASKMEVQAIAAEATFVPPPIASREAKQVSSTARDMVAGCLGGAVSVLLGQPFDLIRVRLQTSQGGNPFSVTKDIWLHEGPRAFYKGAAMPFIFTGVAATVQFSVFHRMREVFEAQNASRQRQSSLGLGQQYLAGGVAGLANSFITGPVEHIRTRLQLQPVGPGRLYAGPMDCIRQIVHSGGPAAVYKAFPVAALKEFQAFGCYFAAFEVSTEFLCHTSGRTRNELSVWEIIPCGALGGIGFWVGSYPIDVVKTKLQNDGFGRDARYRSAWAVVRETWRSGGMKAFWRGLAPTMVRTSLSSAGCFTV